MDPVAPRAQLVEQVYDRLLQAVCRRQLGPGARIAQEDLAERWAVSRQPISHAPRRLKQQGLVRDAGRRGLVIAFGTSNAAILSAIVDDDAARVERLTRDYATRPGRRPGNA